MRSMVAVVVLLSASCYVLSADLPVQVTARLIADVRDHFHAGCVYILHSYAVHEKELLAVWAVAASLVNTGVLRTRQFKDHVSGSCAGPLYVILQTDQQIMNEVSAAGKLYGTRWLVFSDAISRFANLDVPFDCELLVALWDGAVAHLSEVYRVSPEQPLKVLHFGDWSLGSRKDWPSGGLYRRRTSLEGRVIKAAILEDGTYLLLARSGSRVILGGYIGYIWSELGAQMNFTSVFRKSVDGGTGSQKNGTWDGMIGMLLRGQAEVGVSSFLITAKRMEVVDYLHSLAEAGTNVYIRRPEVYSLPWTSSLAPFSSRLWFCVLTALCLLTLALCIVCSMQRRPGDWVERPFGLRDSWLCTLGVFCQQGYYVTPVSCAGRVVYLTSHLCAIVLMAGFAGNYISFLSSGRPLVMPFTSLRGMLEDGSYRLGAMSRSAQINFFDEATDPLSKEVYEKLILPDIRNMPLDYADAFKRVCDSKYSFMSSADIMLRFTSKLNCSIIAVPHATIPGVISMTTVKKFPYRGLINHNLQKMRTAALMKRLRDRTLVKTKPPVPKDWQTISLAEVVPTISVFVLGVLVSVMVLAVECLTTGLERH